MSTQTKRDELMPQQSAWPAFFFVFLEVLERRLAQIPGMPASAVAPIAALLVLCADVPGPAKKLREGGMKAVERLRAYLMMRISTGEKVGIGPELTRLLAPDRWSLTIVERFTKPPTVRFEFKAGEWHTYLDETLVSDVDAANGHAIKRLDRGLAGKEKRSHKDEALVLGMQILQECGLPKYPSERRQNGRRWSCPNAIGVMTSVVNLVYPSTRVPTGRDLGTVKKAYQLGLRSFTCPDALVDTASLLLNYVSEHRHDTEFGIFVERKLWLSSGDSRGLI